MQLASSYLVAIGFFARVAAALNLLYARYNLNIVPFLDLPLLALVDWFTLLHEGIVHPARADVATEEIAVGTLRQLASGYGRRHVGFIDFCTDFGRTNLRGHVAEGRILVSYCNRFDCVSMNRGQQAALLLAQVIDGRYKLVASLLVRHWPVNGPTSVNSTNHGTVKVAGDLRDVREVGMRRKGSDLKANLGANRFGMPGTVPGLLLLLLGRVVLRVFGTGLLVRFFAVVIRIFFELCYLDIHSCEASLQARRGRLNHFVVLAIITNRQLRRGVRFCSGGGHGYAPGVVIVGRL